MDRDPVEVCQALCRGKVVSDEMGVEIIRVGEADKLRNISIITEVAILVRMAFRHSVAVMPKSAMVRRPALEAMIRITCAFVSSVGIRFSWNALVCIRQLIFQIIDSPVIVKNFPTLIDVS